MLKMPVLVLSTALAVGTALPTASDAHQSPAPLAIAPSAPDGDILLVQYGPGTRGWRPLDSLSDRARPRFRLGTAASL